MSQNPEPRLEEVLALARSERVTERVARQELAGGQTCQAWKVQHPTDAQRQV